VACLPPLRCHVSGLPYFRKRTAEVCLVLLNLIQDLQRHRALSGAILDGRREFRAEREATELKLQRSLHAVAGQYGGRHPIFHQTPWRVVLGHWESLHHNWQGLDFFSSLSAHSSVIGGMIGILRNLADTHAAQLGERRQRVIRDWPVVIENLGMLRALGLHVLTRRDADDSEELAQAVAHCLRLGRKASAEIAPGDLERALSLRTARAFDRVAWLMDGNTTRYHPYTFYEEMTGVIDDWYRAATGYLQDEAASDNWFARLAASRGVPIRPG